jgi:tetratricopeptide (TPR) repeat protein
MLIPPEAAFALATVLAASRPVPIPPAGGRETFALGPMQVRRHEIALEAGQFFQATLHQRGVDAIVRLVGPDGSVIEDGIDSSEGPAGMEPVSMLATASGPHVIEVSPVEETTAVGAYELEAARPRKPSARDRERLEAERLMAFAGRRMGPRAAATRPIPSVAPQPTLKAYTEALATWERLGETCWAAEAATCLGISQTWAAYHAEASETLGRAVDGWLVCEEPYKLAEAVLFLGRLRAAEGRLAEAAEIYEQGLPLADGLDPVLTTQFLVQLTSASAQLGDTARAIEHGEQALPRVRAMGHLQGTAVVLGHLATASYRRGDLQRASELGLEALALRREAGEPTGLMTTLLLVAEVYEALGETDLALRYLDEVIESYGTFNFVDEAAARARTAVILQRVGQPGRAVPHLRRAIDLSRRLQNPRLEIEPRLQLVELLLETGAWEQAAVEAREVRRLRARLEDRFVLARAHEVEGRLALHAGAPAEAAAAFAESLALRRYVGDRVGEAATLLRQAELARAGGELEAARTRLEEARAVVAAQRGTLASPVLRATWTSTVRGIDEAHVDVLLAMHARDPSRGYDARAFEAGEAASARLPARAAGRADRELRRWGAVRRGRARASGARPPRLRAGPADACAGRGPGRPGAGRPRAGGPRAVGRARSRPRGPAVGRSAPCVPGPPAAGEPLGRPVAPARRQHDAAVLLAGRAARPRLGREVDQPAGVRAAPARTRRRRGRPGAAGPGRTSRGRSRPGGRRGAARPGRDGAAPRALVAARVAPGGGGGRLAAPRAVRGAA